jgi:hypothetical protein
MLFKIDFYKSTFNYCFAFLWGSGIWKFHFLSVKILLNNNQFACCYFNGWIANISLYYFDTFNKLKVSEAKIPKNSKKHLVQKWPYRNMLINLSEIKISKITIFHLSNPLQYILLQNHQCLLTINFKRNLKF